MTSAALCVFGIDANVNIVSICFVDTPLTSQDYSFRNVHYFMEFPLEPCAFKYRSTRVKKFNSGH